MYNTYIINLNRDYDRYVTLKNKLNRIGISPIRYDAIDGRDIPQKYEKDMTYLSKLFSTDSMKGAGLSHLNLIKEFYKKDPNDYALILEDDAVPLLKSKDEISHLAHKYSNYDCIVLYIQGIRYIYGSTAAYIITKKGAGRMMNNKLLPIHIDMQLWYLSNLKVKNVVVEDRLQLFTTDETKSYTRSRKIGDSIFDKIIPIYGNLYFYDYFEFNLFKLPYINYDMNGRNCIIIILIFSILLTIIVGGYFLKDLKLKQ